jgi:putative transposase
LASSHPPVNPIENAYVESFNGKIRDDGLNEHGFVSLADAQFADRSSASPRPA